MDVADFQVPIPALGPEVMARFARAAREWLDAGATWVDLPWQVPQEFTDATRPLFCHGQDVRTPHGTLLASGEQAFLWLDAQKRFGSGLWIGWTPCFRDEAVLDEWHQYGFVKLEAYLPLNDRDDQAVALQSMLALAQSHFERWSGGKVLRRPVGDGTVDLEINGHEVGSYGIRKHPTLPQRKYVYGTVLAEPRFSMALDRAQS